MPSFDVVSECNKVELNNSIDQTNKEIASRFDFKDSKAKIELNEKDMEILITAEDEFKLKQIYDILITKMSKRGLDVRLLDESKIISGMMMKEVIKLKNGINQETAKKMIKLVKDEKLKVQGSIQGDSVRFSGAKRDDLQYVMAFLKEKITELPLQFNNFRD